MALAELISHQYEAKPLVGSTDTNTIGYRSSNAEHVEGNVFLLATKRPTYRRADIEMKRIALQSRRPVVESRPLVSNHPTIDRWIGKVVDSAILLSLATVATAFFIFLLELSSGRPAFLVPSFSAVFVFSVVGIVALRLKKTMKFMLSDDLR